jgi:hypothetical protein
MEEAPSHCQVQTGPASGLANLPELLPAVLVTAYLIPLILAFAVILLLIAFLLPTEVTRKNSAVRVCLYRDDLNRVFL